VVCRRFRNQRDDECHDELGELHGSSLRRFAKRRNCPTLRGHQSDNLSFKRRGMTRRSMPRLFHANLFVLDVARCPSSTRDVTIAGVVIGKAVLGDVPFLPAVGDTPCAGVASRTLGKMRPGFWPNSGSHFPDGVGCGKCDPEYCSETGCGFPDASQTESASHSGAPKRDVLSAWKNCRSYVKRCCSLLAQNQRCELVLGVHHVVGAGGFQLCAAAEAPADARTLKAGVVAGQDIDIGIAHIERGRRIGA